jgi:hypothetical protein
MPSSPNKPIAGRLTRGDGEAERERDATFRSASWVWVSVETGLRRTSEVILTLVPAWVAMASWFGAGSQPGSLAPSKRAAAIAPESPRRPKV